MANLMLTTLKALVKGKLGIGGELDGLERFMLAQFNLPDRIPTMLAATNIELYAGSDIQTEEFVEAVKQHQPDVLGLSALLTILNSSSKQVENSREKSTVMIGKRSLMSRKR